MASRSLNCDTIRSEVLHDHLGTDICLINSVKWEVSAVFSILLLCIIGYMLVKWKNRCHKTLLTFHNLRAAVALLLLAINSIELAKALLPLPHGIRDASEPGGGVGSGGHNVDDGSSSVDNVSGSQSNLPQLQPTTSVEGETQPIIIVIGSSMLANAIAAIILTIMLMWYHRVVEIKKSLEYLYVSCTVAVLIFMLRIYELAEIVYYDSIMELESVIQASAAACLLFLAIIDGFTVYKERYRPDYLEDYDKIGYKHTLATFYSKACFWWLTPLLWFGYKEPLELEDLGQMRVEDSARAHYDRFLLIYKTEKVKHSDKPPSLWLCYLKNSWRMFTLGGLLKLFGDLFAVIGPLAIQQIVQYIEIMYGMHYATHGSNNNNNNSKQNFFADDQNPGSNSNNNLRRSIRSNQVINAREMAQQALNAVTNATAAASNWLPNATRDAAWPSSFNDNLDNNDFGNINTDVYNQIANGNDDYNATTMPYASLPTGFPYYSPSSSSSSLGIEGITSDSEVEIYYATWSDLVTNGWCIAWLVLLAALAQGALSQASTHILNMTGIRIKTSLQGLIYRKTLLLNSAYIETNSSNTSSHNTDIITNSSSSNLANSKDQPTRHNDLQQSNDNHYKSENGVNSNCNRTNATTTKTTTTTTKTTTRSDNNRLIDDTTNGEDIHLPTITTTPLKDNNNVVKSNDNNSLNDIGAITNLMSEDTLNIMSFFWIAHYVWAIPLKIGVVMYLLYLKLGISAVIGSFVCILTMTPLQFLIGKAMSKNAEIMAKFTDIRLKRLHDCFMGIKLIKLNAWDNVFIKKITEARDNELKYLNKDSFYWTLMTILTHISSVLITFVTLAVYVYYESNSEITASRLFSALALFQQLTVPLLIFPITVPIILSAIVSTKRLEKFLAAHEIQKQFEGIRHMARILSKSDASLDMYEVKSKSLPINITLKTVSEPVSGKASEKPNIKIYIPDKPAPLANSEPQTPLAVPENREMLEFPVDHKKLSSHARKELLRNTPYVVIRPRKNLTTHGGHQQQHHQHPQPHHPQPNHNAAGGQQGQQMKPGHRTSHHRTGKTDSWHRDSLLLKMPDDIAVSVKNCKFSWNPQATTAMLYIRDILVPRGKLTMIVGKNGSGKSSLLSALLMEMPLISGDMIWNKSSTIAFVPQQPWLLNASIRENILFGESFRPKRYDFVLDACALKPDIDLMPAGDLTVIGERGINLSGGQRQRVAIARALYSSANVVIMDDPLSSLDNEVARHIFEQSIKKMLLKANRTVILVTQQLNLVQQAHNLIVLKDGCLQASGSYKEIAATHPHIIAKWNSIIAKANEKEQQNNPNENTALGRTARERWKLFKNVTKLGLLRSTSCTTQQSTESGGNDAIDMATEMKATSAENILAADDDEDDEYNIMPATSSMSCNSGFKLSRTPSSFYSSRHLIYDVPLPLDECQTEGVPLRRRRRTGSDAHRGGPRPSSRTSSRLSNISNTPTELRRSLLTDSVGSAVSYMTNLSSSEEAPSRTQSWQPTATLHKHQPLTKNVSAPPTFEEREENKDEVDAPSMETGNGFQQFLRRMTMRRSNKSKTVAQVPHHRANRPGSGDTAIVSISEESSGIAGSSVPSIELSSVLTDATETETESWIAGIENEESIQDANIDYKALLANNGNHVEKHADNTTGVTTTSNTNNIMASRVTTRGNVETKPATEISNSTELSSARQLLQHPNNNNNNDKTKSTTTATATNYDVERKYGKIPAEIYLLYMRASGFTIVLIFFITALIWQTLRVYTDVWLQQWTDDNKPPVATAGAAVHGSNLSSSGGGSAMLQHKAITSVNISAMQQMGVHNYATTGQATTSPVDDGENLLFSPSSSTSSEHHEVTYYFHIYAIISCVCIVMAMISTPAGQWAGCKARRNLHDKLLQSIMYKSLHFFQVTPLGRIMNRFSNDMAIIDKKIAATSQRLLQFTLLCVCAILINIIITPWFIVVTVPVCLAYYVIQKFYRCSSRELQRIENATNTPVISHLSDTIQGVTTIRAYNQESRFTEILFRRLEENTIAFTILNTSNRWLGISLDYLGGVIVFVAIVTALLAATIACNSSNNHHHDTKAEYPSSSASFNASSSSSSPQWLTTMTTALSPSPSLVGLAINYTLLMPIYLNWVVKLLADMEMYVGSVERIAYYAENDNDKASYTEERRGKATSSPNDDNSNGLSTKVSTESKEATNNVSSQAEDVGVAGTSCAENKVCSNDKLLLLSPSEKSDISTNMAGAMTTSLFTTDNNVNETVVTIQRKTASNDDDGDDGGEKDTLEDKKMNVTAPPNTSGAVSDDDHHITNDGHIAVTTKTLSQQQGTTSTTVNYENQNNVSDDDDDNNAANPTSLLLPNNSNTSDHINIPNKTDSNSITRNNNNNPSTLLASSSIGSSTVTASSKLLPRCNDAERRASVRRLAKHKKQYKPVAISWPQRGDISFENVSLRYEGQQVDVIRNLNLKIPAGQRIGICGRTGSGKSSLALSLFGVLQVSRGCIRIDDNDISHIHPDEVRTRLSIIPQDVHLFNMTIRENLDPSGYYSDLELWNCLELAQLKGFVNSKMPQGLDTEIMDGGINLSVGHRQLFCLARAILRGSVCLVLDEATSSLDSTTEKSLLAAAHKAFQGRTIITIAHRLSTILDYDRVIVLEKGEIIEDGPPGELKNKVGGIFAALLKSGRPLSILSTDTGIQSF
ncbi:sulfonylurea receptor [Musca autumnalis]|uniref:sulfonylurea receptor n=1 Tax=Musca autumnalis TaxID=221902 RepID=UPI003CF6CFCA